MIRSATTAKRSPDHQHFGNKTTAVVGARHRRAIGACGAEHRKVVRGNGVDLAPHGEGIAGFADRADNMRRAGLAGRCDGIEIVPCIVERGAGEVVHRGIYNDERSVARTGFTRITRVSSTPALPQITRPGSNINRTSQPLVARATIAPYSSGVGSTASR